MWCKTSDSVLDLLVTVIYILCTCVHGVTQDFWQDIKLCIIVKKLSKDLNQ